VIDSLENFEAATGSLINVLGMGSKLLQSSSNLASAVDPNNTDVMALKMMDSDEDITEGVGENQLFLLFLRLFCFIFSTDSIFKQEAGPRLPSSICNQTKGCLPIGPP